MQHLTPARILTQRVYTAPGKLRITEYRLAVPRDHLNPSAGDLTLFARSARRHVVPADPTATRKENGKPLPWLLFLQGGPGFGCRTPGAHPWTSKLLDRGYEVLFLDQRGTGMSSPLSAGSLSREGDVAAQVEYLKLFRADSIVQDCEAVRMALTGDDPTSQVLGPQKTKWSIMGQSFGGFCCLTYLSKYPESVVEAFIFGGLGPVKVQEPSDIYEKLFMRVRARSHQYYEKYPEDEWRIRSLVCYLDANKVDTPNGGRLTARRLQQLGINLGFHDGLETVHDIILRLHNDLTSFGSLMRPALAAVEDALPFDNHVIYSLLHEAIYCQGTASCWAAKRVHHRFPAFDPDTARPYFTAEMIFPWMFHDYKELRLLQGVANALAKHVWPATLYDLDQLAKNKVPVYAAVYVDDLYVDFDHSLETARAVGKCKTFICNAFYHDAVRSKTDEVWNGVFALRDDVLD